MKGLPELIANERGRYSVQSSDAGLHSDADGGVTLSIGPAPPSTGPTSSWLATEPGRAAA